MKTAHIVLLFNMDLSVIRDVISRFMGLGDRGQTSLPLRSFKPLFITADVDLQPQSLSRCVLALFLKKNSDTEEEEPRLFMSLHD